MAIPRLLVFLTCFITPLALANNQADPWEGFNRSIFAFNDRLDRFIIRPVAVAYGKVTPAVVDQSVTRVFSNAGEPMVIINDLAQFKWRQAVSDTARFLINTTIGFFGVFDVATPLGFQKHNEDFGQTLGYWGVGSGPYIVLPFLGSKTLRSLTGDIADQIIGIDSNRAIDQSDDRLSLLGLRLVDLRSDLIPSEGFISGDRYTFIRSAYLQRREYLVNDGIVFDDFDDDFDDDF